jgi:predicted P-loop ATPase
MNNLPNIKIKAKIVGGKVYRIDEIENYLFTKYDIRINVITNAIEFKLKDSKTYETISDSDLRHDLYKSGFSKFDGELKAILGSKIIPKYNPLKEYFETLPKWSDSEPDYIQILSTYCQTDDQKWFEIMFRKHLIRMVGQALNTIQFNKHCLTLVGKQNDGKTSFFNFLVPPALKNYYKDTFDFNGSKDGKFSLVQNFLINLDELAQFEKKDLNKEFKSVLTTSIVKFRLLFQNVETPHNRSASFVATTNEHEFLTDETGNVRWIPFVVRSINHDSGGENGYNKNVAIDRVWAQAYSIMQSGETGELKKHEVQNLELMNKRFMRISPEMDVLSRFLQPSDRNDPEAEFMQPTQIIEYLKTETSLKMYDGQVGRALKSLGFERTHKRVGSDVRYGYFATKISNLLTTLTTTYINN